MTAAASCRLPLRAALTLAAAGAVASALVVLGSATQAQAAVPSLKLSGPPAGKTVSGSVKVVAKASSPAGISRVEFRVDGRLVWTERTRPYVMMGDKGKWRAGRLRSGVHTLRVTAVDRRGRKTSVTRRVRVVRGTAPPSGPAPPSGGPTTPSSSAGGPPWYFPRTPPAPPLPPPSLFVSTSGSDGSGCGAAAPCRTLVRAYQVAAPGQVVQVAGGSYSGETFGPDPKSAAGQKVYFVNAPGATASFGELRFQGAGQIEIRGLQLSGYNINNGSRSITLRNIRQIGDGGFITSSSDIQLLNSEIGPVDSIDGLQIKRSSASGPNPTDILIDGIYMHDLTRNEDPSHHTDCIQAGAGERVIVRNSIFNNCATQGIFLRPFAGGVIRDWVIENNYLGPAQIGFYSLILNQDLNQSDPFLVRNNSATQSLRIEARGADVIGNIGPYRQDACLSGANYRHNVWSAAKCGSTDITAAPGFVNAGALDLRLAPGSAAINRGDPGNHPAADIFGMGRPLGGAPDAGAHERQ